MTPIIDARISRLLQADRETAIAELRQLAQDHPADFLDLLALVFEWADDVRPVPTAVQFVIMKQPGSDNRS